MNKFIFVFIVSFTSVTCASTLYSTQMSNYEALIDLYNSGNYSRKDFIPIANISKPMYVHVAVDLLALSDFDEVSGSIDLTLALEMNWTDEIPMCNGHEDYSEVFTILPAALQTLLVPIGKIWSPDVVLLNSVGEDTPIGGPNYKLRIDLRTGSVTWHPKVYVYSSCSPDVTYYPFDRQICTFVFLSWGHRNSELLFTTYGMFRSDSYTDNGEWDIKDKKIAISTFDSKSRFEVSITIERKPLYFAFNIISPVLVLAILNGMVFWLPVESGERVGFSVTCFLSFVVLLNMIMEMMPESSSPMAYICFYTVCMMLLSGLNSALVIVQMHVFYKPEIDQVPKCLISLIRFIKCRTCKNKNDKNKISIVKVEPEEKIAEKTENRDFGDTEAASTESEKDEFTWQDVANSLDVLLFWCFLIGQLFFSISFLIPLFNRI